MTVQTSLAIGTVNQFGVPLSVSLVCKSQDWQTRQKISYQSIIDNIRQDFHGLADFKQQMTMYSNALGTSGKIAWQVIQALVPNNAKVLSEELEVAGMGLVGAFLLSIPGFGQVLGIVPQAVAVVKTAQALFSSISSTCNC